MPLHLGLDKFCFHYIWENLGPNKHILGPREYIHKIGENKAIFELGICHL